MQESRLDSQGGTAPAVAAVDVTRRYGEGDSTVHALRGVTMHVPQGQFTAVMGPSGSGKSTLMHIMAGLDRPTSGSVEVAGQPIGAMDDNELTRLRRDHVGFIFQFFNLLPMLTAEENILLPLQIAGRDPEPGRLEEILEQVGLGDRRTHRPAELSGGQQQRVAIGRALIGRPTVLFADEPTGNLDSKTGEEILGLIRQSVDGYGQTTVMVTHDPAAAASADRVLFIADGLIAGDLREPSRAEVIAGLEEVTDR
ncbi:MAG TPA: ABC transporter ATP-binding protein [Thermoleophilaceae bacterium]